MVRALISVNGTDFPEPSTYEANTATLVDSARNVQGVVIGSVIRDDVAKVSLTWRFLTVSQWSNINKLFNPRYGGSFYNSVTYFDQTKGDYDTRTMYVSDRSAKIFRRDPGNGNIIGYENPSLSLVEV